MPVLRAELSPEIGYRTDRGQERDTNEDAVWVEPSHTTAAAARGTLCVVADGVGGHEAGEVASRLAIESVREHYYGSASEYITAALEQAVAAANAAIWQQGQRQPGGPRMGSTVTAAVLRGSDLVVAHVGDSRAYLIRGDEITQLTRDHSIVGELLRRRAITPEQAESHPMATVITRALGKDATVEVDVSQHGLRAGDVVLLCSDGLIREVDEAEIHDCVRQLTPQPAADTLVALANQHGASDNVSVVVVRIGTSGRPAIWRHWPLLVAGVIALLLALSLLFASAAGRMSTVADSASPTVGQTSAPIASWAPNGPPASDPEGRAATQPFGVPVLTPTGVPSVETLKPVTKLVSSPGAAPSRMAPGGQVQVRPCSSGSSAVPAPSPAEPAVRGASVPDGATLRSSASRESVPHRGQLMPQERVRVLWECTGEAVAGSASWYRVEVVSGQLMGRSGFVHSSLVLLDPSPVDTSTRVPAEVTVTAGLTLNSAQTPMPSPAGTRSPTTPRANS